MKDIDLYTIGLAGNPNVGKSTVFNALTGMKQHTGNWTGKTVATAKGKYAFNDNLYNLVDLPGIYSLDADSPEEEIAGDYILNGGADAVIVVCDATCLERNLNLVFQVLEITPNVILCLNLIDEAKKKNIKIDVKKLEEILKIPVVPCCARNKKGLNNLCKAVEKISKEKNLTNFKVSLPESIEKAIGRIIPHLEVEKYLLRHNALEIIKKSDKNNLDKYSPQIKSVLSELYGEEKILPLDIIKAAYIKKAEEIAVKVLTLEENYNKSDRKFDKFLTGKYTALPVMLVLLFLVLWITVSGANYPSQFIYDCLFKVEDYLTNFFVMSNLPEWLHGVLVLGVYRVLAWVVSVMLPPMAIFFPMFTLLEDFGYLPRVAFNLDNNFEKAASSGKQALTMCMGLGCNAVGVTECRIINSPRERLIAILTNSFMPCNGRFPTLIAVTAMFFGGMALTKPWDGLFSAAVLSVVIVSGVIITFIVSKILSKTLLKGVPSSFALEMPSYRPPQIGRVIVRSIFDRTLFVLGRAVVVAAPAGLIIWIMANTFIDGNSILNICAEFLNPFAAIFGMDGIILLSFILGFPANEIVVPIMIMAYTGCGALVDYESLESLRTLFVSSGWTVQTAISVLIFTFCHWPCSTTCLTVKKETGSFKWTLLSFLLPTAVGFILCFAVNVIFKLSALI